MLKKTVLILIITALVICLSIATAIAVSSQREITALLDSGVKILFDGEVQTMRDANGNIVYPVMYNGTTYLPVRAVSNMLGLFVDWDPDTRTVILESGKRPAVSPAPRLTPSPTSNPAARPTSSPAPGGGIYYPHAYPGLSEYIGHYSRGQVLKTLSSNPDGGKISGYFLFYDNIYPQIINIWYTGNRLCVDFDPGVADFLNSIYEEDIITTREDELINRFVNVFSTYPDVGEIEFFTNGEKGIFGNKTVFKANKPISSPSVKWDTAEVSFYKYTDYDEFTVNKERISYANLLEDTVKYLDRHNDWILIIGIRYEGRRLVVDLDPGMGGRLDAGSMGGYCTQSSILRTFASYPGVNEMKFLIGGVEDCEGNHFNLQGIFKAADYKK